MSSAISPDTMDVMPLYGCFQNGLLRTTVMNPFPTARATSSFPLSLGGSTTNGLAVYPRTSPAPSAMANTCLMGPSPRTSICSVSLAWSPYISASFFPCAMSRAQIIVRPSAAEHTGDVFCMPQAPLTSPHPYQLVSLHRLQHEPVPILLHAQARLPPPGDATPPAASSAQLSSHSRQPRASHGGYESCAEGLRAADLEAEGQDNCQRLHHLAQTSEAAAAGAGGAGAGAAGAAGGAGGAGAGAGAGGAGAGA
eukprot:352021-Hanusia_phi.AAC.1